MGLSSRSGGLTERLNLIARLRKPNRLRCSTDTAKRAAMSDDRILPLEGVHNFRDYGAYPTSGGGRVRCGLLWRSGQHGDATEADLAAIDALRLATVVDLRGISERDAKPCRRGPEFAAEVLHHEGETA